MNQLLDWLSKLFGSWKPWIVVPPWDVGVRVRLGKSAIALKPGLHLRIPFIDVVILVNTRLRVTSTPPVTLGSGNGKCRMISATVGYRITDPVQAMLTFDAPHHVVTAYAQTVLAEYRDGPRCLSLLVDRFACTGIDVEFLRFVEDLELPALRLLQNSWGVSTQDPQPNGDTPRY